MSDLDLVGLREIAAFPALAAEATPEDKIPAVAAQGEIERLRNEVAELEAEIAECRKREAESTVEYGLRGSSGLVVNIYYTREAAALGITEGQSK